MIEKAQIVDVIRQNPALPYEEVRSQALESGLSRVDFDGAWAEVHPEEKGMAENDHHVRSIGDEINRAGVETKTREEWKTVFKAKGFGDDECDLGYVLSGAKIDYGPFSPKWMLFWVALASVAIFAAAYWWVFMSYGARMGEKSDLRIFFVAGTPLFLYFASLSSQFQKYCWKVIEYDFGAKAEVDPNGKFAQWKKGGAEFLGVSSGRVEKLFGLVYDKRETYFGSYVYWVQSGKHRRKVERFMIAQRTRQVFPHARCVKPMEDRSFLRSKVQLEGRDFNAKYNVYAEKPVDAFYVFNPRVMSALLDQDILKTVKSFETAEDWIVLVFEQVGMSTGIRFGGPVMRYDDYQKVKRGLLRHLDLATDINDVLSRHIVDDGSGRSEAKIA